MYRKILGLRALLVVFSLGLLGLQQNLAQADEVNVYSARKEALILPLLEKFEAETGIGFNLITAKEDELLKRLVSEGRSTPAGLQGPAAAGRAGRLFPRIRLE